MYHYVTMCHCDKLCIITCQHDHHYVTTICVSFCYNMCVPLTKYVSIYDNIIIIVTMCVSLCECVYHYISKFVIIVISVYQYMTMCVSLCDNVYHYMHYMTMCITYMSYTQVKMCSEAYHVYSDGLTTAIQLLGSLMLQPLVISFLQVGA